MKTITRITLTLLAIVASGCGNKKATSDYSNTLPADSVALMRVDIDDECAVPEDFVRPDETVFEKITGDLNNDGKDDCVIITKQTDKSAFVTDEYRGELDRNRRGLLIAFKQEECYKKVWTVQVECYKKVLAVPDCFSSENEDGGVYFPPELSVEIVNGNLRIHYGHGRYGWWQYTFRYRDNEFKLIGYDTHRNRGPVTESIVSINFLTRIKQTLTNTNPDAEGGDEVFDETWQDIELPNGLVRLADIGDFDGFSCE